jgi:hypothetical protein
MNQNRNRVQEEAPENVYMRVVTFARDGNCEQIGSDRLVNMSHIGTQNWFYRKHLWWAMTNNVEVVCSPATEEEFFAFKKLELALKYNSEPVADAA